MEGLQPVYGLFTLLIPKRKKHAVQIGYNMSHTDEDPNTKYSPFRKDDTAMKINRRMKKRLVCALMALVMLAMMPLEAMARTTAEVEAEQAQLEAERQELQERLEQLKEDTAKKQEYQETLQKQIEVLENQIRTARNDIDELNASINELTMKLDASQEEIADTIDQFKQRVAAIYRAGTVSTLEVLLNSESLGDFTLRAEMLNTMSKRDQDLIDKITEYMDATKDEREECEAEKQMVADLKKSMERKQGELDELYKENAAAIEELQGKQNDTNHALEQNAEEIQKRDDEIKQLIEEEKKRQEEEERRRQEAAANGGGGFSEIGGGGETGNVGWVPDGTTNGVSGFNPTWPLPGVTYISDEYGGSRGHGGMDIAGPSGTPIVAAESGTVIRSNNTDYWGMGWGYHVYIYHNDTYSTLYAHMSATAVSTGEYVSKGQVIGYEGSTGDSTGPHLHFEVWQNGVRVNPRPFLFG